MAIRTSDTAALLFRGSLSGRETARRARRESRGPEIDRNETRGIGRESPFSILADRDSVIGFEPTIFEGERIYETRDVSTRTRTRTRTRT